MERVRILEYENKKIVLMDFSYVKPGSEFVDVIKKAKELISHFEPGAALTLIDVTNSEFDLDIIDILSDFARQNTPFVRASAVLGATGIHELARKSIEDLSNREFKTFTNREEALKWLSRQ